MNVISLYYHVFITSDSKATMLLEMYLFQHWSNCMFQQMKADKTGLNVSYRMVSISALITIHDIRMLDRIQKRRKIRLSARENRY